MISRQEYIDKIIFRLSILKAQVSLSTPVNLNSITIISENFFRDFLNLLFGYHLVNINISEPNAAAIDLGDKENKICFQVTATAALGKVKKTIQGFVKKNLQETYDKLIILNIVSKSDHQERKVGDASYELDTHDDIWDIGSLIKVITDLTTDRLKEVCLFLDKEIKIEPDQTLAKEIQTFMSLIGYLSDETQPLAGTAFIEAPDPDRKIYKRFSNHSAYLIKEYQDLYTEYGLVLIDVLEQADIGHARIRRLGLHLKSDSNQLLTQTDDNPETALNLLIERYENLLKTNGIKYELSAIRFFLVDQLIKCNVFPNPVVQ